MRPPGQRQVDAAKADGRWDAAYAPMRSATVASIPEDLRAAIEADPRALGTFETLGRQNLFALAFRTNSMKTPAGRARKIASLVAMLARGEAIFPESGRGRKRHADGTIVLTAVAVVPESQLWTVEEPYRSRIRRGLACAAETKPKETQLDALVRRPRKSPGRSRGRRA